jgi:hypothetical protein
MLACVIPRKHTAPVRESAAPEQHNVRPFMFRDNSIPVNSRKMSKSSQRYSIAYFKNPRDGLIKIARHAEGYSSRSGSNQV